VRFFRNCGYFFAYVASLLPLSAIFFTRFFVYVAGLLFPHLAALLELLGVFFPLPSRLFSVHHQPPVVCSTMIVRCEVGLSR